jgi:endoglucanase
MRRRGRIVAIGVLLVVVTAVGIATARYVAASAPDTADRRTAKAAAASFLDRWMNADGRIVRRDQGNDTVSEGQAYGLLLAAAARDRTRFAAIWTWTRSHLQRPDQLFAWRWDAGRVVDNEPAADADLDVAIALLDASKTLGQAAYASAARSIARAVLQWETVPAAPGRVVVAGPWATKPPITVDPSYVVAGTATRLAQATGDSRWTSVAAGTRSLDHAIISADRLPPDWAVLGAGSASVPTPTGSPDGSSGPRYGFDAPRLFVRLASSCDADDRSLAASAQPIGGGTSVPAIRALDGSPEASYQHPVSLVAAAAVAAAAGEVVTSEQLLDAASRLAAHTPTYYGDAWSALGRVYLSGLVGTCGPLSRT